MGITANGEVFCLPCSDITQDEQCTLQACTALYVIFFFFCSVLLAITVNRGYKPLMGGSVPDEASQVARRRTREIFFVLLFFNLFASIQSSVFAFATNNLVAHIIGSLCQRIVAMCSFILLLFILISWIEVIQSVVELKLVIKKSARIFYYLLIILSVIVNIIITCIQATRPISFTFINHIYYWILILLSYTVCIVLAIYGIRLMKLVKSMSRDVERMPTLSIFSVFCFIYLIIQFFVILFSVISPKETPTDFVVIEFLPEFPISFFDTYYFL